MFVHDDRLVRRLHERHIAELRRIAEFRRLNARRDGGRARRSLRRSLGRFHRPPGAAPLGRLGHLRSGEMP